MTRRPLTIAMPTPSFLPGLGGMEVGLHNIAKRLAARGHRVFVMPPASQAAELRKGGFSAGYGLLPLPPRIVHCGMRHPVAATRVLAAYFSWISLRHGIDVWHATMAWPVGAALGRLSRFRRFRATLMRSAGADIQIDRDIGYGVRLDPLIDDQVRALLPRLPAFVAITDTVAREYMALGIAPERIVHIPNGVDRARFAVAPPLDGFRDRHHLGPRTFVFLCVGRNHAKKNLSMLIEAARVLRARSPDADFAVVLAGKGVAALAGEIAAAGMEAYFILEDVIAPRHLSGDFDLPADALVSLYKTADCFIFPSLIETFGIALVEAMAAGLPVLTADSPGCRDIADGGRYAALFDPGDAGGIAETMQRAMEDAPWREGLRRAAAGRAADFDWESIVSRYEDLYRGLLDRPS